MNHLHQLHLHASQTFTYHLPLIKHHRSIVAPRVSKTRESWEMVAHSILHHVCIRSSRVSYNSPWVCASCPRAMLMWLRDGDLPTIHSQNTLSSKSFLEANKFPESFRNNSVDPRSISAWLKLPANSMVTTTIEAIPLEILLYILEYLRDISTNNDFTVCHRWKQLGYSVLWTNVVLTNHNIKTFARSVVEVDESICRLLRNLSVQFDPVPPKTP